ncbi:anaerobic sulfatase maturase [Azotosporobacter soli]|uniref:anaerobic sulfatase maturase n=1 Tax=Azotosporobacter soli TaxID=3055040 RepID=UPI0031FF1E3E
MKSSMPIHVLAKPSGAACNLDCAYCFFLSKSQLYPGAPAMMSDKVVEEYIRQLCNSNQKSVTLSWQGGEPTLVGLDFYRRAVSFAAKYRRPGQTIQHTFQTNGLLLDDAWCTFFKEHHFLVGLSIDGPQSMHDAYRVDRNGVGSFKQVMHALSLLRKHRIDFNLLCSVHAANVDHPAAVYHFLRDELQAQYIQFIPIVERVNADQLHLANRGWKNDALQPRPLYTQSGDQVTERSVDADRYGRFLIAVYDEWVRNDVGAVFVQTFDVALGSWLGQHNLCIFSPTCGNAVVLEKKGDLYSCDHYVEPDYRLGSICETEISTLAASKKQRRFGLQKSDGLPNYCRQCDVLFACHGECPRNRFRTTPTGEANLNYLCAGYQAFFRHIRPTMDCMAALLRQNRYADEIMQLLAPKTKHNDPL